MTNISLADLAYPQAKRYADNQKEFQKIFGVPLDKFWLGNLPYQGFDVIKFDEKFIKPPDGTSCKDQVEKKFGKQGMNIILKLLGTELERGAKRK